MDGMKLKSLIISEGYTVAEIASIIGTSQQNLAAALKHDDVRSGLVEKIAAAMEKPLAFFYGESYGTVQTATGNNNTQVAGSSNNIEASAGIVLEMIRMKDEQLTIAMQQTSKAQEQMDRVLNKLVGKK